MRTVNDSVLSVELYTGASHILECLHARRCAWSAGTRHSRLVAIRCVHMATVSGIRKRESRWGVPHAGELARGCACGLGEGSRRWLTWAQLPQSPGNWLQLRAPWPAWHSKLRKRVEGAWCKTSERRPASINAGDESKARPWCVAVCCSRHASDHSNNGHMGSRAGNSAEGLFHISRSARLRQGRDTCFSNKL